MKVGILTLVVFVSITCAAQLHAQKSKGTSKKSKSASTLVERVTKYMQILEPRPCSFYLADWGSSLAAVKDEAKRIGLTSISIDTSSEGTLDVNCTDPESDVWYSFGFSADGGYTSFMCGTTFRETADAVARIEKLSKTVWLYWDGKQNSSSSISECPQTSKKMFIYVNRKGDSVTLSVQEYNR